ncbi:MAG: hypothetical protein Fur0018_25580 [Anaerolineales bacterium]
MCSGHDHAAHHSRQGSTHLLNPGEVMGLNGARSLTMVDTLQGEVRIVPLP